MKKIQDSITKKLKPIKIYLEELSELHSFLLEISNDNVEIQACGYELENFEELKNLQKDEIHDLKFTCKSPYLSIDFSSNSARVYCGKGDIASEGIVSRIYNILKHSQIKRLNLLDHWWIGFFVGLPLTVGIVITNIDVVLIGALLILIQFVILAYEYQISVNKYSTLILKSKKEKTSFWKRNKDQVILLLVGAFLGAIITIILNVIKDILMKKP